MPSASRPRCSPASACRSSTPGGPAACASSPSHLRRFDAPVRHVLLAALLFQRQREITDTLVELLSSTVHRINVRAEKKVTEAFVAEFTKVRGKSGLLGKIAEASLGAPDGSVRSVVYPAAAWGEDA